MDVSIDSLFSRIGRQLIELEMLRSQVAAKDQIVAAAEAEIARLLHENAALKSATENEIARLQQENAALKSAAEGEIGRLQQENTALKSAAAAAAKPKPKPEGAAT